MLNNYDNKNIRFTGDPVAFDGVEGKRDPKTGKGRFDLIPTEVFYPLFAKADHDWLLDCHPASILMSIADEKFIDAIIKMTIYAYAEYNEHYAASSSEFWNGVWPMLQDLAIHFQKGAEHYGERNCQKGIPLWSFKDSAMRHATQVFEGKKDEPHSISVIWNCWLAAWTMIKSKKTDGESDTTTFGLALEILHDRRKKAKKELYNTPSDSPEFKGDSYSLQKDIDGLKEFINDLSEISNKLNIPVVTAQQKPVNKLDELIEEMGKNAKEAGIQWPPKEPKIIPAAEQAKDTTTEKFNKAITNGSVGRLLDELTKELLDELQACQRSPKYADAWEFVNKYRESLNKMLKVWDQIATAAYDQKLGDKHSDDK